MDNGCKPTRLWHRTGIKHFRCMLNAKLRVNPYQQRPKTQQLLTLALFAAIAFVAKYSFEDIADPMKKFLDVYYPPHYGENDKREVRKVVKVEQNKKKKKEEDPACPCMDEKEKNEAREKVQVAKDTKNAIDACKCD